MSDSVTQYLNEIGLVPLLTAEEERELSQTIERGREAQARLDAGERSRALRQAVTDARLARHRFIRANLRLVVSIARRYPRPPSTELLDLIQEGNLGLEHAVDKFDWRKGLKFSTYGTYWIRQAVGRALNQKASLIRLPDDAASSLHAALRHASGDADQLDDVHGRLYRLITPTSLDRPVGADDGIDLSHMLAADVPSPEGVLVEREAREMLKICSPRSQRGPAWPSSNASASPTAANAATARSASSSASLPRPPAGWSSVRSTSSAKTPSHMPERPACPVPAGNRCGHHTPT